MKLQIRSYREIIRSSIAGIFLLLFISNFVIESFAYNFKSLNQSELVDFEGDTDSEEDSKNEQEKEQKDQLLFDFNFLISENTQRIYLGHIILLGPNAAIQEVLSPPPELG